MTIEDYEIALKHKDDAHAITLTIKGLFHTTVHLTASYISPPGSVIASQTVQKERDEAIKVFKTMEQYRY